MSETLRSIVICGPSGSGKSTLLNSLKEKYPTAICVSHTTRKPRVDEVNGREFHFIGREEIEEKLNNSEFIEFAEYSGNLYGTSKKSVEEVIKINRICILDVDIEGVKSFKRASFLKPIYIFIKPPSIDILRERLRERGTETAECIEKRMSAAKTKIEYSNEKGVFNHIIINDDRSSAFKKLEEILHQCINECLKLQKE